MSLGDVQDTRKEMNSKEKKADTTGTEMEKDLLDMIEKAKAYELWGAVKGKLTTMKGTFELHIHTYTSKHRRIDASTRQSVDVSKRPRIDALTLRRVHASRRRPWTH